MKLDDWIAIATLTLSAIAAVAAVASALIAWRSRGAASFIIETSWYDGEGADGRIDWTGTRRGFVDVTLRNISTNPASEVRLETDDCTAANPHIGVLAGAETAKFTLTDVGENPTLIVRYRLAGRGRKRRHDVELSAQPRTR